MFRKLLDGIDAALPSQCAVCRAWPARPVCDDCVARFAQPVARCRRCAIALPLPSADCGQCLREPAPLDGCHAAVAYDFPWSALIAQFKFQGQAGWARSFAVLMRSAPWVEPALDAADLVLPMPLSRERLAERGFNQSLLLARELAPSRTDPALLLRVRHTPSQASLDASARRENVKGAFAVEPTRADALRGRRIVIVDDVMTSGASLRAAAQAVRAAGASQVVGIVLARTGEPG